MTVNLAHIPHILLGGSTGSGKSVLLKLLLMQALRKGAEVYIADFKGGVDFSKVWHQKCRMCFTEAELLDTLDNLVRELEQRKGLLAKTGCPNLDAYNEATGENLPRLVFGCDEVAEVLDRTGCSKGDKELLAQIKEKGIKIARVTLHVGLGTFRPVKVENILEHHMHSEFYVIDEEAANTINETKANGGKIVSVGTTSTRTLETVADENGHVRACSGWTDIFIYPGYKFKVVDRLITNFHLPESTLLMLVSALYDREKILEAYKIAVEEKYRFFSFGDAMLIL